MEFKIECTGILVPIDFSEITDSVIESAKFFSKNFGNKLYILHVIEKPPIMFYEEGTELLISPEEYEAILRAQEEAEKFAKQKLEEISESLTNEGIDHEIIVQTGEVVDTILDVAQEKNVDFIAIGSHKHGLLDTLLLGTTAEKIIEKSDRSVFVVKGNPLKKLEKLLLGYDFLPNSQEALKVAEFIATTLKAELVIVHADTDESFAHFKSVYEKVLQKKIKILEELKNKLEERDGIKVSFEIIKEKPSKAILDAIEDVKPDMVILGRRKTSVVKRIFLGTTASKVVKNSPIPVMIVRREK